MVTNECVRFNYDRLRADKALGNFRKPNNNNKKNNVRSAWDPFRVQKKSERWTPRARSLVSGGR